MKSTSIKNAFLACLVALIVVSGAAFAKLETSAIMSKNCDEKKIRELAGEALSSIAAQDWGGGLVGYTITLDTDKLTFQALSEKMQAAGCF